MPISNLPEEQHNIEIHENFTRWKNKPILQKIYLDFYYSIASQLNKEIQGKTVELGSGIGNMKMVVPEVICTDIFPNPWIDQVENAYKLSFENNSASNLILFDVWHHLKFPGDALNEFNRVLKQGGRVIIFEPYISLFGLIVYGLLHHEPIAMRKKISWFGGPDREEEKKSYYAAQGNATRIFCSTNYKNYLAGWNILKIRKMTALSYVLSGGYSKKQLYPDKMYSFIKRLERFFDFIPGLFATRVMVVLEKNKL